MAKLLESFSLVTERMVVSLTRRGNLMIMLVCRDCLRYWTQAVQEVIGNMGLKLSEKDGLGAKIWNLSPESHQSGRRQKYCHRSMEIRTTRGSSTEYHHGKSMLRG